MVGWVGNWELVARLDRRHEADGPSRRFLTCWIIGGLVPFAVATHQRGDLVAPLLPAAALLAGRELAHLWAVRVQGVAVLKVSLATSAALPALAVYQHQVVAREELGRRSEAVRELAGSIAVERRQGAELLLVDTPFALEVYLGRTFPHVSFDQAASHLATGERTLVGVHDYRQLVESLGPLAARAEIISESPSSGEPWVRMVRMRPPASIGTALQ